MVYKEKGKDRDGVGITAHNGITQCAMPLYCCLQCIMVLVGVVLKYLLGGTIMWQSEI